MFSRSESVRDIQINPHNYNIFATTTQYGLVQIWDMRNPNEPLKNLYGHTEPVYSCDWHSEMPFLATSGLDKSIKVTNIYCYSFTYLTNTLHFFII